jgi:hypothetical protein
MPVAQDPRLERLRTLRAAYTALRQDLPSVEEQIALLRAIIAETKSHGLHLSCVSLAQRHCDLGAALFTQFMHLGEDADIEEAEVLLRLALPALPPTPFFPGPGSLLGSVLRERATQTRSAPLVEEALVLHRLPFNTVAPYMPALEQARRARELGRTLCAHFELAGNSEDTILESMRCLEEAQALFTEAGVVDHACLTRLRDALASCYDFDVQPVGSVLHDALLHGAGALVSSAQHRDFYEAIISSATLRLSVALKFDDNGVLDRSIEELRMGLTDAPLGWAILLAQTLACTLCIRFNKQGHEGDLREPVTIISGLLDSVPPNVPQWGMLQESLCKLFCTRFEATRAAKDIEAAVRAARSALAHVSVGSAFYIWRLNSLAGCRGAQARAFGDAAHLDECIRLLERVLELASPPTMMAKVAAMNLVEFLLDRYRGAGALVDLHRAIELLSVMGSLSANKRILSPYMDLYNAGNAFLLRFGISGSSHDLEQAHAFHQEAVKSCERNQQDCLNYEYHKVLHAYSQTLLTRSETLGDDEGVLEALQIQERLCEMLPIAHPDRVRFLCGLARIRLCRYRGPSDVDVALDSLLDAVRSKYCPALRRFKEVSDVLASLRRFKPDLGIDAAQKLSAVYSGTIDLLPQVASFGFEPRTRMSIIAGSGSFTAQGAIHAISHGQLERALEMLEAGRNIFWAQNLRLRTPFSALPAMLGGTDGDRAGPCAGYAGLAERTGQGRRAHASASAWGRVRVGRRGSTRGAWF